MVIHNVPVLVLLTPNPQFLKKSAALGGQKKML